MSEMTGGLSDPIERGAWSRQEGVPKESYLKRMTAEVEAETATVTEEEIAAANATLPDVHAQGVEELGTATEEIQRLHGYMHRLTATYGIDDDVPAHIVAKRQTAYMAAYGALGEAFPKPEGKKGQTWICKGWRVVFIPDGLSFDIPEPEGRA